MQKKPIRVSQLNAYIARLISTDSVLSDIAVKGEVSNFKIHSSGHVFFSLKDDHSRIDCFLPAGIRNSLEFELADGIEIIAEGSVNVYEKGGRYSLTIRRVFAGGQGDLALAFEKLKQKLGEKGYFEESRKKSLPFFPKTVAIVTSDTGAAIEDMLKIIRGRNNVTDILIFPTLVQGPEAAAMIAARIRQINADFGHTDVIITGRGGGSSEDLNAFNEETVADAIFESVIPVISAVGHETDFTIADFVADRRAETPTAAAALAVPDTEELSEDIEALFGTMRDRIRAYISHTELRVRAGNMDMLLSRLKDGLSGRRMHADRICEQMRGNMDIWTHFSKNVNAQMNLLEALNPKKVLERGYSIIERENGEIVTRAGELTPGETVSAVFADGKAVTTVKEVQPGER